MRFAIGKLTMSIHVTQPGFSHRYLNLAEMRRLQHQFFASRKVVEGLYAGRHTSPQRGHSVEFVDYRQYQPGDEFGDIDWKVYGRTDKLMIRMFEHQSDMTVHLVLDASASMSFAGMASSSTEDGNSKSSSMGPHKSKYDLACQMAGAIAFLTTKQQDKISLAIAQQGLKSFNRPAGSFSNMNNLLDVMEQTQLSGESNLPEALQQFSSLVKQRGLVIVFSDLLDDMEATLRRLDAITHRGCEVILFHVMHEDELQSPSGPDAIFVDSETSEKLPVNVADVRIAYKKRMQQFLAAWVSACKGRNIDYKLVSTAMPYHEAIANYLFSRSRM